MNEASSQNAEPGTESDPTQSAAGKSGQSQSTSGRRAFESFRDAVNAGAEQARAAAEEAAPKIKGAVADATYWVGYSVSFATVFSYVLAKELAPDILKGGFADGADAGKAAGEKCAAQFTQAQGDPAGAGSPSVAPSASPGMV